MLRSSLALLLICAGAPAFAQNSRAPVDDACQSTETHVREATEAPAASMPRSSGARNKYGRKTATASGGGGGSDEVLPRARGSKWHNFLPGMFR